MSIGNTILIVATFTPVRLFVGAISFLSKFWIHARFLACFFDYPFP